MDIINLILQAVSTIGFPCVSFFLCFWALKYTFDKSNEQNGKAFQELAKLTEAINNNTITLTKLCEKVDDLENDGK